MQREDDDQATARSPRAPVRDRRRQRHSDSGRRRDKFVENVTTTEEGTPELFEPPRWVRNERRLESIVTRGEDGVEGIYTPSMQTGQQGENGRERSTRELAAPRINSRRSDRGRERAGHDGEDIQQGSGQDTSHT